MIKNSPLTIFRLIKIQLPWLNEGKNTIPLDRIVMLIKDAVSLKHIIQAYILIIVLWDTLKSFIAEEAALLAKAAILELPDMFLPPMLVGVAYASISVRFMTTVRSVSDILFFSVSIPCLLAINIPISVKDILIIWFERTMLTLIISTSAVIIYDVLYDVLYDDTNSSVHFINKNEFCF